MKKLALIMGAFAILAMTMAYAQENSTPSQQAGVAGKQGAEMKRGAGMNGGPGMMGEHPMMGRGFRGKGLEREGENATRYLRLQEDLKLTADQLKKLKDINVAFRKDMIDKRAKLDTGQLELSQLLDSDDPDMSGVEKKVRANHQLRADIAIASIRANKAADAVLTADQLKSSKKLTPRFQQTMRPMGTGGQGRHMGPRGSEGNLTDRPGMDDGPLKADNGQ